MSSFISRLEPRYIFDAGAVASGVAVAADVAAQSEAVEQINEILASDGQSVSIASFSEQVERLAMVGHTEDMTSGKMIVFVDADLGASKIATLKSGLAAGVELHLINSNADALVQMAAVLEGYREVSSVHILSHGSAGILAIGDSDVDFSALTSAQQAALYSMNVQLASNADLLIYGCDFGAGELGKAAVNVLSNFTGADVAASDDATGSTRLGADWDLETTIGQIETEIAFSAKVQDAFEITLSNTVTVSGSTHPKGWFNIADSDLGTVTLTIDDTENLVADGDADNLSLIGLSIGSITAVALDGSRSNPTLPDDIDLSHIPVTTQKTVDGEYTLSFSTGDLIDTLKTHLGDQVMTGNLTFTVGTGSSSVDATLDNFFYDLAPPPAPFDIALLAEDDTGSSNSDGVTSKNSNFTITGSAEFGAKIEIFIGDKLIGSKAAAITSFDADTGDTGSEGDTSAGDSSGSAAENNIEKFSINIENANLADGTYEVNVRVTDSANNMNTEFAAPLIITIDTSASEFNVSPVSVDGVVNAHEINSGVVINGTAEAGANVVLSDISSATNNSAIADANGNWSFAVSDGDLEEGVHYNYTVTITDVAGNVSTSTGSYTVDRIPPVATDTKSQIFVRPAVSRPVDDLRISSLPNRALLANTLDQSVAETQSRARDVLRDDLNENLNGISQQVNDVSAEAIEDARNITRSTAISSTMSDADNLTSDRNSKKSINFNDLSAKMGINEAAFVFDSLTQGNELDELLEKILDNNSLPLSDAELVQLTMVETNDSFSDQIETVNQLDITLLIAASEV